VCVWGEMVRPIHVRMNSNYQLYKGCGWPITVLYDTGLALAAISSFWKLPGGGDHWEPPKM
jgi:hypothetical protein